MRQFRDATILRSDFERLHAGMQRAGRLLNWKVVDSVEDDVKTLTLRDLALDGGMDDVVVPEPEPEPEPLPELPPPTDEQPTLEQWIAAGYLAENYEQFMLARDSHPDNARALDALLEDSLPDVEA